MFCPKILTDLWDDAEDLQIEKAWDKQLGGPPPPGEEGEEGGGGGGEQAPSNGISTEYRSSNNQQNRMQARSRIAAC